MHRASFLPYHGGEMFHRPTSSAGDDLSPYYRRHDPISFHPSIHPSIAAFGLLGSVLVDVYGVRKVSMTSMSIVVVWSVGP